MADRVHSVYELEAIEITDNVSLRNYVNAVRELMRSLSLELEAKAEYLKTELSKIPKAENGRPSQMRASKIANPLYKANENCRDAAMNAIKTHAAFKAEFAPELEALRGKTKPKKAFKVVEE